LVPRQIAFAFFNSHWDRLTLPLCICNHQWFHHDLKTFRLLTSEGPSHSFSNAKPRHLLLPKDQEWSEGPTLDLQKNVGASPVSHIATSPQPPPFADCKYSHLSIILSRYAMIVTHNLTLMPIDYTIHPIAAVRCNTSVEHNKRQPSFVTWLPAARAMYVLWRILLQVKADWGERVFPNYSTYRRNRNVSRLFAFPWRRDARELWRKFGSG
jgi:hypothetical protein